MHCIAFHFISFHFIPFPNPSPPPCAELCPIGQSAALSTALDGLHVQVIADNNNTACVLNGLYHSCHCRETCYQVTHSPASAALIQNISFEVGRRRRRRRRRRDVIERRVT